MGDEITSLVRAPAVMKLIFYRCTVQLGPLCNGFIVFIVYLYGIHIRYVKLIRMITPSPWLRPCCVAFSIISWFNLSIKRKPSGYLGHNVPLPIAFYNLVLEAAFSKQLLR